MRYALNFKSGRSKEEDKKKAQRESEKRDVQPCRATFKDMEGWQGSSQAHTPQQRQVPIDPPEARPQVPSHATQVVPPTVRGTLTSGDMPEGGAGAKATPQPSVTFTATGAGTPEKHRLSFEQPRERLGSSAAFHGVVFSPIPRSRSNLNVNDADKEAGGHAHAMTSHHTELVKSTDGGRTHITTRRAARPQAEGGDCLPCDGNPRLPGIRVDGRKMSMDGRPSQAEAEDGSGSGSGSGTGHTLTASSSFSGAEAHADTHRRFSLSTPSDLAIASRRNSSSTSNIVDQAAAAAAAAAGMQRLPPVYRGLSFSYDDPALDSVAAAAAAAQAAAAATANGTGPSNGSGNHSHSHSSTQSPRASVPLSHASSRVERLLRDRQIRRSNSYLQLDMSEALAAANGQAVRPMLPSSGSGSGSGSGTASVSGPGGKRAGNSGPLVPTTTVGGYHIGSPPQGGVVVRPEGSPGMVMSRKSRTMGRHITAELLGADSRNSSYDSLASSRGSEQVVGGGMGERSTSSGALASYQRAREGSGSPATIPPLSSTGGGMGAHAAVTPPPPPPLQRLLIVANRLPVKATQKKDGTWGLEISSGGLVSALLGE